MVRERRASHSDDEAAAVLPAKRHRTAAPPHVNGNQSRNTSSPKRAHSPFVDTDEHLIQHHCPLNGVRKDVLVNGHDTAAVLVNGDGRL
jgi:hypothetical protein